jgi:hypothetical protein
METKCQLPFQEKQQMESAVFLKITEKGKCLHTQNSFWWVFVKKKTDRGHRKILELYRPQSWNKFIAKEIRIS